jgi:hypothetical protein
MFEPNFNDLDAVFFQKKHHRRIQRVRITLKAVLLWVKVFYFGLGDFLRAKKFLTRPPSVVLLESILEQFFSVLIISVFLVYF